MESVSNNSVKNTVIKQILIERGLWIKGMRGSQDAKQRAKMLAEGKDLLA